MDYILFTFEPNKSKIEGLFDEDDGNIYIDKKLSSIGKQLVFAHESQHRTCFYSKCECWDKESLFWCEYHAFLAELIFVVKQNSKKYWDYYFKGFIKELIKFNNPDIIGWLPHFKAMRKVSKIKVFQNNAKKYGYLETINKTLNEVE